MARGNNIMSDALALEIRRQIGTEPVRRFARSLPAFSVDQELPRKIRDLLGELETAEHSDIGASPRKH